jgi:hypothetical protein
VEDAAVFADMHWALAADREDVPVVLRGVGLSGTSAAERMLAEGLKLVRNKEQLYNANWETRGCPTMDFF